MNSIWPVLLGGVPRRGRFHSGKIDERTLKLVGQLVESGSLKGVTDSVWPMEDALKVCSLLRSLFGYSAIETLTNLYE